jgi:hypothetical protein
VVTREVRPIASRERVLTSEFPNFRDHGRMVDRALLRLTQNLQRRYGQGWASEGGLRRMICQDTGHCPGVTTIAKALVRLARYGIVVQVHLVGGQILPDGELCTHGTRLVWIPRTARQRQAAKRFNKELAAAGERRYRTRMSMRDVRELTAKIGAAERPSMPPAPAMDPRARAREQIERARREHPELWDEGSKPPDKPPD